MKARSTLIDNFKTYWLPVIFWMCFIFWMSNETFSAANTSSVAEKVVTFLVPMISSQELVLIHAVIRKATHVIEYFILGLLLFRAFRGGTSASWNSLRPFLAFTVVVLFAVSDELHQYFVRTRMGSYVDVGIDAAGGLFAQLASLLRYCYWRK